MQMLFIFEEIVNVFKKVLHSLKRTGILMTYNGT